ncbi:MAG: DUF1428 domain-containing protein [Candidatus Shapirobacteria bacterium]|jgi:uncharacterized protein YbaA (DUF1428 family)
MSKYVDGFVLVVPSNKTEEYKKIAEIGRDSWMKHGALNYFECRGDDMKQQEMGDEKTRFFPEMVGASSEETVWFSFITFKSKAHRDEVNALVMAEMAQEMSKMKDMEMPVNMNRMAYGGFEVEVEG